MKSWQIIATLMVITLPITIVSAFIFIPWQVPVLHFVLMVVYLHHYGMELEKAKK